MGTGTRWDRTKGLMTAAVVALPILVLASTARPLDGQQVSWNHLDTLAVLGGGPTWSEPPFYRVFDAILDNERNIVFLANGGDGELIRYDVGSGQIERIGRRGRGPGEFGRPLWIEPYGPDSLLVYDHDLIRFSVFSRTGRFGRTFRAQGTGLRGKEAAAVARLPTGTWVGVQSGTPQVLMGIDTPPGTKERNTLTVYAMDDEGNALDTIASVPHGLWERLPDTTSFDRSAATRMLGARAIAIGADVGCSSHTSDDPLEVFDGIVWVTTVRAGDPVARIGNNGSSFHPQACIKSFAISRSEACGLVSKTQPLNLRSSMCSRRHRMPGSSSGNGSRGTAGN